MASNSGASNHDIVLRRSHGIKGSAWWRTRTRTLDPLIKSLEKTMDLGVLQRKFRIWDASDYAGATEKNVHTVSPGDQINRFVRASIH